ncbi:type I restriction-modification system endonuclease [Blastopirellula marina DSM 3645]|uniref:Type I restriction enzyme endonuclease subunit n=2 Tax=Blastopirellula marina TaxID=124 RepID=A3ZXJ9_9BACT|nr:type I restriction-modification system endonuclease [Blastopirellula marina DSM 3645]
MGLAKMPHKSKFAESTVEEAAQDWFAELGYTILHGPYIAPGEPATERDSFGDVVLIKRLQSAIDQLNPTIPAEAREEALRKVLRPDAPSLVGINRRFHQMLRDGVAVEYRREDGSIAGDHVRLIDFGDAAANDWLVVNQLAVTEGGHHRRPDLVLFVNGLPLVIIELKNAADEDATIWTAWNQLQTYKQEIPSLFHYNELLVVSDGLQARLGALTASTEWFKVWRDIAAADDAPPVVLELEVLIKGVFAPARFLDLLQHFITYEEDTDSDRVHKIIAGYHQFHAVNQAVESTIAASREGGDQRGGVVWHTQGSGKSFSMLFYAGRIVAEPAMANPTLVVLTDRNDLDDQLYGQFLRCHELLRQKPVQAEGIDHLKKLLQVVSGGVVFTTIQKFRPDEKGGRMPLLSDRRNIVVIADEAHRSQYDLIDGLARNMRDAMPNASFIGFTGTPIEKNDANTRAVFGDYVSIYDIQRAVKDKATVPIYYESRVAKLSLNEAELPKVDTEFDELTEGEEQDNKEKIKTKWAALEALVGTEKRLSLVAEDMVQHFERRLEAMDGKAMIVCMSRRICVDLYKEIIKLRPDWASAAGDDETQEGKQETAVKIIMTGSASDPVDWQPHIRTKRRRKELASRFKNPKDPFRIVIVRDMWLTGFDAPCLHTMYVDKPMQGHGLMQAIARVNRVFRDKPGGLVVDYLGLADQLKKALGTYTESGGRGAPSVDTAAAVAVMLEKYEICCDMMHVFDWSIWMSNAPAAERLKLIPAAQEHVLQQEEGKARFTRSVTEVSQAFALCASHEEALRIRDDIAFFQAVRAALVKPVGEKRSPQDLDHAVRQLVSKAISADDQIIDVFTAAGLKKPDISILSDEFLAEVRGLKHKNVAAELLQKLLKSEIKERSRRNVVQARMFSEMLQQSLNGYHNRAIATQEVIEELITVAKEMQKANRRGEDLGLGDDEICFYDALAQSNSAVEAMGIPELKVIAAELVTKVRSSVTIDWQHRESARAKIRTIVRRILRHYGYPPDLQAEAVKLVLEQAEVMCADWAV